MPVILAIKEVSRKWTVPIRNYRQSMNRFIIEFEECLESLFTKWQLHYRLIIGFLVVFSIGAIFVTSDFASGGFITSFIAAFGLITIFVLGLLLFYANKNN